MYSHFTGKRLDFVIVGRWEGLATICEASFALTLRFELYQNLLMLKNFKFPD